LHYALDLWVHWWRRRFAHGQWLSYVTATTSSWAFRTRRTDRECWPTCVHGSMSLSLSFIRIRHGSSSTASGRVSCAERGVSAVARLLTSWALLTTVRGAGRG